MEQIQSTPLKRIRLSITAAQAERRQHFDKGAIAELADSLASVGMLSPIIVRPFKFSKVLNYSQAEQAQDLELVAGERRYLAAKHAKLDQVPVSVRELSDEQVLEVQLVENLQREDLHELAEAEGYEALQKLGHSAEDIANKVGKSKASVYARMKLLSLSKAGRKAFYEDKITASVALLLARIPVEKLQDEALKAVTTKRWGGESMSYREAAELIQRDYMLRLSDAGFKTEDATLVPAAGACGPCPKRTGNQRELFGDVKGADVCTDPVCFKSKLAAHAARAIEEAEVSGQKIISGTAAKKIFPHNGDYPSSEAVKLTDHCYEDSKNRTYAQLLGKDFEPTLVLHPESGKIIKVATTDQVRETFKEKGIKFARSGGSSSGSQNSAEKKAKLEKKFRGLLFGAIREKLPNKLTSEDQHNLAIRFAEEVWNDSRKILAELWGVKAVKHRYGQQSIDAPMEAYLRKLPDADLPKAFLDMIYVRELQVSTYGPSGAAPLLMAAAKKLHIDAAKIRKACQPVKAKAKKRK